MNRILVGSLWILALARAASGQSLLGMGEAGRTPAAPPPVVPVVAAPGLDVDSLAIPGRITLVDFWATTCLPCRKKLPYLEALARRQPSFVLRPIQLDDPDDPDDPGDPVQDWWDAPVFLRLSQQADARGHTMAGIPWLRIYDETGVLRLSGPEASEWVDAQIRLHVDPRYGTRAAEPVP